MYFRILISILTLFLYSCENSTPNKDSANKNTTHITTPKTVEKAEDKKTETTTIENTTYILDDLLIYNSEKDLIAKFGSDNVKRKTQYYPEGMGEYTSTALFPDTPNEVIFNWGDDTLNFEKLGTIKVGKQESEWTTTKGLKIGVSLKELEKINKKEFKFYGFEWDYAGTVDWNGGALEDSKTFCTLTYSYDYGNPEIVLPKAYESLVGDHEILSSNEDAQSIEITVSEIILSK